MASYNVLIKETPAQIVFVREGFSFFAFVLGPVWFASKRAWLGVLSWVCGVTAIGALAVVFGASAAVSLTAMIAFMFLMGLEASEFRRRSLMRRGYQLADVVESSSRAEAEIRFCARRLSVAVPDRAPNPPLRSSQRAEPVGLFLNGT